MISLIVLRVGPPTKRRARCEQTYPYFLKYARSANSWPLRTSNAFPKFTLSIRRYTCDSPAIRLIDPYNVCQAFGDLTRNRRQ